MTETTEHPEPEETPVDPEEQGNDSILNDQGLRDRVVQDGEQDAADDTDEDALIDSTEPVDDENDENDENDEG